MLESGYELVTVYAGITPPCFSRDLFSGHIFSGQGRNICRSVFALWG